MKSLLYVFVLLHVICTSAQTEKFKGQAPITIVPTTAKPIQKQWKGLYKFDSEKVVFSNDFEGARLNGIVQDSIGHFTALITSENTPINPSPWYAFKVWSPESRSIFVTLTYQEGAKHRYYPKLSTDGLQWSPLDTVAYTEYEKGEEAFGSGSLAKKVRLNLTVGPDILWIAGQELQSSTHVFNWMKKQSSKKYVQQRPIGKSREGRPMKVLTIGDERSKNMLMVISRQHPPEVTGYLAMKAFVETITGDSKLARRFRKKFTTYVVPLMNPDGVDNGHWRHNTGGTDLNRDWANFNQPETKAVQQFMEERVKQTQGKFYFGIDFHSTWDDIYYTVDPKLKGNMPGLVPDWLAALKVALDGYDPNIKPNDKLEPTAVSRNHFFVHYGAEALVFEIGDNTPRAFIQRKGRAGANALMQLMLDRL